MLVISLTKVDLYKYIIHISESILLVLYWCM